MLLRPGEIFRLTESDRPAIVVSREALNRGNYVVVVPVTTKRLDERRSLPNCVYFRPGQFGFDKECVAQADAIALADKADLDLGAGPVGQISQEAMRDVIRAIGNVVGAECEPL